MMKNKLPLLFSLLLWTGGAEVSAQSKQKLSFGVVSDIHLRESDTDVSMTKVPQALKNLTSHGNLDALVVVGDLTDNGRAEQYARVEEIFSNEQMFSNPVGEFLFMMGNHDNYDSNGIQHYQEGLRNFNGGELYPLHSYRVIKGYPFLSVSVQSGYSHDLGNSSYGDASYPASAVEWLKTHLEKAAKECPGKPIFVFTHVPPRWTCYSTWAEFENESGWCMKVLNPVLNNYPQAVVFGGHSHYPVGDPRSIHQGANPISARNNYYTVINTGSTTYSEIEPGVVDVGIHPAMYDQVTEGLIIEEQENGDIEVRRYDTYRNQEISPEHRWVLKAPFDGSMFQYADIRDADDNPQGRTLRNGLPAPAFAEDASLSVVPGARDVVVSIPQAKDDECVFRYKVQVKEDGKNLIMSFGSVFSQFYLNGDMPETVECKLDNLKPETDYIMEVFAYDSYGNVSAPLEVAFTTEEGEEINSLPKPYEDWKFDDPENVLKTENGQAALEALAVDGATITPNSDPAAVGMVSVEGPSDTDLALFIPSNAGLKAYFSLDENVTNYYTLQMDIRVKNAGPFCALLQNDLTNGDDADLFVYDGKVGVGSLGYGGVILNDTWHRVVMVNNKGDFKVYVDGKLGPTAEGATRWDLDPAGALFFCDNSDERVDMDVAEIAFWDTPFTEEQVQMLCGTTKDSYLEVQTPNVSLINETNFSLDIKTSVEFEFVLPDWIKGIDVQPQLGLKSYTFRAESLANTGRRTGIIQVKSKDFPVQEIKVSQICMGDDTPEPKGLWTFENEDNLLEGTGCATLSGALTSLDGVFIKETLEEAEIVSLAEADRPMPNNGCIGIPVNSCLVMNTNLDDELLSSYTIMLDVRPETLKGFNSLYKNSADHQTDGSLFIKNDQIGLGGYGLGYTTALDMDVWHRIVMVVQNDYMHIYVDGVKIASSSSQGPGVWTLHPASLFFSDNDGEELWNDVAEIRFWDLPLTEEMVAGLGRVEQVLPEPEPVPEASTIWTFNDAGNLLAGVGEAELYCAVRGEDGRPLRTDDLVAAGMTVAEGPSADNGAITVPVNTYLGINHNQEQSSLSTYAVLLDIRPKNLSGFQDILQTDVTNSNDGSIFLRNTEIGSSASGLGYNGTLTEGKWHRIILSMEDGTMSVYVDGRKVGESGNPNPGFWSLNNGSLFFADNDAEEGVIDVAEMRFWNVSLSSSMAKQLGSPSNATSISTVKENLFSSDAAYDLFGRRVDKNNLKKGIYIVGGHKIVVR